MLIFDELKKNDPQLRLVAVVLAAGLGMLLAGLWWVQVVSAREYQSHLETQSYRTVRIPAVRGKILDRRRPGVGREPSALRPEPLPRRSAETIQNGLQRRIRRRHQRLRAIHCRAGEKARASADQGRTESIRAHHRATGTTPRTGALQCGQQRCGTSRPGAGPAIDARRDRI